MPRRGELEPGLVRAICRDLGIPEPPNLRRRASGAGRMRERDARNVRLLLRVKEIRP
jgi:hypothetical protein